MYKSPIEVFMTDIQHQIEQQRDEEIYKAVVSVGINVDKEELIRALKYDRGQYEAGLLEGMATAKPEWIPVTERLPEDGEEALCLTKWGRRWVSVWNEMGDHLWTDGESWLSNSFATHWMPLPEPPKEGADHV